MKNLLFLLISFFCLANAQQKKDSVKVIELVKVLQEKTEVNKKLMQENKMIQKENESLMEIVFLKVKKWISHSTALNKAEQKARNREATKTDNQNNPVTEIDVHAGVDTIRGGWIYRLFHQNNYYYKPYKIQNNEKVYLD